MKTNREIIVVFHTQMVSIKQAAKILGIVETRAYRLVQSGELSVAHEADGKRYIKRSDVTAYSRRRDAWLKMHGRVSVSS